MTEFTHINQQGHAKMVDVSDKQLQKELLSLIQALL